MNKALWIARKNYLFSLIKKISDYEGGDELAFLHQICSEIIELHRDEKIEEAIACFEKMVRELKT